MSAPTQKNQVIDTATTKAQKLGLSKEIANAVAQSVIALWTTQNPNNTNYNQNTQGTSTTAQTATRNQGNSTTVKGTGKANSSNTNTTRGTANNATTNARSVGTNNTTTASAADRSGFQGSEKLEPNWNNKIAEMVTNTVSAACKVDPTLNNKTDALAELIAATITAVAGNNANITVAGIKQQVVTAAKNKSSAA